MNESCGRLHFLPQILRYYWCNINFYEWDTKEVRRNRHNHVLKSEPQSLPLLPSSESDEGCLLLLSFLMILNRKKSLSSSKEDTRKDNNNRDHFCVGWKPAWNDRETSHPSTQDLIILRNFLLLRFPLVLLLSRFIRLVLLQSFSSPSSLFVSRRRINLPSSSEGLEFKSNSVEKKDSRDNRRF